MKSARIGYSFATAMEAVLDCLGNPNTTWTVLSASKAQSEEFIEEGVRKILEAMQGFATISEEPFVDELGTAENILVTRADLPNGSRILALPANPRTARGYPGNAILDEFGHHEKSYQIWAAISRQVLLGHKLRVLSTPNGRQGKFYDLAKEFKLTEQIPLEPNPKQEGSWSCHFVNVEMAIGEGCPINLREAQELYKADKETENQELHCAFLQGGDAWIPLELIARAEHEGASSSLLLPWKPVNPLYCGIDVARDGDRTCVWLLEKIGDVFWVRLVRWIHNMPFFAAKGSKDLDQARELLPYVKMATRTAMDSTGIGLGLFEWLAAEVPGRVMGVNFAGSVKQEKPGAQSVGAETVKIKTHMAVNLKQHFELSRLRIPHDEQIRAEIQAIKKEYSGGAITFNAPRIEIDTPTAGGKDKKAFQHADAFWAVAMGLLAASGASCAVEYERAVTTQAAQISGSHGMGAFVGGGAAAARQW